MSDQFSGTGNPSPTGRRRLIHCCLDIRGGMRNARMLKGCITVDGRRLDTVQEIRNFLQSQLDLGRRVLPMGDCEGFDYQTGCPGHYVEVEDGG